MLPKNVPGVDSNDVGISVLVRVAPGSKMVGFRKYSATRFTLGGLGCAGGGCN